jgi:signal transduction histidine kinase
MSRFLYRFFAPPVFPGDDEKTRTGFLLTLLLWIMFGFVAVGDGLLVLAGEINSANLVFTLVILVVIIALAAMVKRGHFMVVSTILSVIILVGTFFITWNWGTIRVLQLSYLLIAFGIPTLLFGRRIGLYFLLASILWAGAISQAEMWGWLPSAQAPTARNQWVVFTLTCIGIYIFLALSRWMTMDALEQAHREVAARQRTEKHLHSVANILRRLNAVPSVNQTFPGIAAELRAITGCSMSAIALMGENGRSLQVNALDHPLGQVGEGFTFEFEQSAAAASIQSGKVHQSPELRLEKDWLVEGYLHDLGFCSMITVPMMDGQNLLGTLSLLWNEDKTYDQADLPVLVQIADALALSLARSRSFDEAQRRVQEADTLREASAILTETLDQQKASQLILDQLQRVVPYASASVMLLRKDYLEIIGGRGWDAVEGIVGLRFAIPGDNPNSCVVETRQTLVLDDAPSLYPNFARPPFNAGGPILSWLGIPLLFHDRLIGMLTLDSPRPAAFTTEHVNLCCAFADQVAVVLENARLYAEARQRAIELEESVSELENFSYTLSHDLRAPLRAIDGYANILLEEKSPQMDADELRYVRQMAANARQMGRLLDDLLAFIRLGRRKLDRQPTNLAELTQQVVEKLQPQLAGRTIQIVIGELPTWQVDSFLFHQMLRELLANAIQFTQDNPVAKIEIGSQLSAHGQTCFVRDNGIGFDMSYATHLFQVFHRLHASNSAENTGVGLALAQRVIKQHGGRIWAESAPGQGATFYFTIGNPQ